MPRWFRAKRSRTLDAVSPVRDESNRWLARNCRGVEGEVLSIGSSDDGDGQGGYYRDYFSSASGYTTSEVSAGFNTNLVLDVQDMHGIKDGEFQGVFCSGVLEHILDFHAAVREIHRILSPEGLLLLGLPFRQGIHHAPTDYWRFTEHGIRHMLDGRFAITDLAAIGTSVPNFPVTYWCAATRKS